MRYIHLTLSCILLTVVLSACDFNLAGDLPDESTSTNDSIKNIGGNPSAGATEIYASANLNNLCVDSFVCDAPYETLPDELINTGNSDLSDTGICDFDYSPNESSTFVLNKVEGTVNGLKLLLSKEDLFFMAWVSLRYKINPYFLMGILAAESRGNCAAVSSSHGEGCFQITNTFGQSQLDESYPTRVQDWYWTNRSGSYYPDDVFVDGLSYFGEEPLSDQFRVTLDPSQNEIYDTEISSIVNFHYGIIGSGLYFYWQEYLLYLHYDDLQDKAAELFALDDGKALWQAAAYNGGAYGASNALDKSEDVADFLIYRPLETQNYAPLVVNYCHSFQGGSQTYNASYSKSEVHFIIDLLRQTYPPNSEMNWSEVKEDVDQVFFEDSNTLLTFVDDIKALIYVISTFDPKLAPEWPDESSL